MKRRLILERLHSASEYYVQIIILLKILNLYRSNLSSDYWYYHYNLTQVLVIANVKMSSIVQAYTRKWRQLLTIALIAFRCRKILSSKIIPPHPLKTKNNWKSRMPLRTFIVSWFRKSLASICANWLCSVPYDPKTLTFYYLLGLFNIDPKALFPLPCQDHFW